MARPLRIEFPGATFHVTSRGDRREPIYRDDADRLAQLQVIGAAMDRFEAKALAYCLMGNHYHLVGLTPQANLSRLMQCQLPGIIGDGAASAAPGLAQVSQPTPLLGVVAFNGFGSLLWPYRGLQDLNVPVLLVGGSLDLVTPPVQEQLAVFARARHPRSRLVLVEGASHFSPVRIESRGEALFQLGEELVGIAPLKVQALLLNLTTEFLQGMEQPSLLSPQLREQEGVQAYVLDGGQARRWRQRIPEP
jgi:hypothetical protein